MFHWKSFNSVDIDLKILACGIRRITFSRYCWIDIYRWKLMLIERCCEIVWSLCFCMVHSVINNSGLSSVELKKKLIFDFFFAKLFSRGGSIPTLYFKTFNIFFSGPDFWKIYLSAGLTASVWHDESSTHRDIFLKSGSEKILVQFTYRIT